MKLIRILFLLLLARGLVACYGYDDGGDAGYNNSNYIPVLMDTADLKKSISFEAPRKIHTRGRVYVDTKNLFVVEHDSGIHFFDNTDPSNPKPTGFLKVLCCQDMMVNGSVMFVNNAVDMVSMDISDPLHPLEISRIRNMFPEMQIPDNKELQYPYTRIPASSVIVGWKYKGW